jgi:hypothetical protein
VAVDLDGVPAERARLVGVRVQIPAVHRLATLAKAVDVENHRQVVQAVERRVLERLPD